MDEVSGSTKRYEVSVWDVDGYEIGGETFTYVLDRDEAELLTRRLAALERATLIDSYEMVEIPVNAVDAVDDLPGFIASIFSGDFAEQVQAVWDNPDDEALSKPLGI